MGFKPIHIPYFIQLNKESVKTLFGVNIETDLFDIRHPSLGVKWKNTPAYLCSMGVQRMLEEFKRFPDQYIINYNALKAENDCLSGFELIDPPLNDF